MQGSLASGLPKTTIPFLDPWIEDWPEPDHLFQGSQGQPPDFGEQLALPPPSPLPLPMPFLYPLPQSSPPPLFPPLPQDAPFSPCQPFPPHEFFNYNTTEGCSVPPNLGRCLCSLHSQPSQPLLAPFPAWPPVSRLGDESSWITLVLQPLHPLLRIGFSHS